MANELTQHYQFPKPNPAHDVKDDVIPLGTAFEMVDAAIHAMALVLATKAASDHGHGIPGIAGLSDALASKMDATRRFALGELSDVVGASSALNNYILTKVGDEFALRSALSVLGPHNHPATELSGTLAQFNAACTDADFAPIHSPAITGTPTAPTAALGNKSTLLATTAFVANEIVAGLGEGVNLVENGGFEFGIDKHTITSGGGGTVVIDSMWGRQLTLYNPTSTSPFVWILTDYINVAPLTEYTASHDPALFASGGTPQAYIDAVYFKTNGDAAGESDQTPISGVYDFDNDFSRRKAGAITFTTPADVTKLRLRVVIVPNGATITLAANRQIKLERGGKPTPYNAAATMLRIVNELALRATLTGVEAIKNKTLANCKDSVATDVTGTAITIDPATTHLQRLITNGHATITWPTPVVGMQGGLEIEYGGAHTIAHAGGARKWAGGTAMTPTGVAGKKDFIWYTCLKVADGFILSYGQNY